MTRPSRILVTGAAGFVGSHLVRRLVASGLDVTAAVRPGGRGGRLDASPAARVELDLRERADVHATVAALEPDWVFHTAAHGAYAWQNDPAGIVATNVVGTANLVDACLASGCSVFVNTGSSSEYGRRDAPAAEADVPQPETVYAASKVAATAYVTAAGRATGRRFVTLRLFSVYGPGEDERRLIPTLIRCGRRGELPPLVAPEIAHDYVHVDDVVDAYISAATVDDIPAGDVFNVGTGIQTTIAEVVAVARHELSIHAEPQWGSMRARDWDSEVWVADPRKAAAGLGWHARRDFAEGFRATVAGTA